MIHFLAAHGGEPGLDFGVKLGGPRVPFAGRNQAHQFHPLGGQAIIALFEQDDHFIKTGFSIGHGSPVNN